MRVTAAQACVVIFVSSLLRMKGAGRAVNYV